MSPVPALWRRALHLLGGLLPLAFGVWRWQAVLSLHTFLITGGLFFTVAVVVARGRAVKLLAEFTQAAITLMFLDLTLRHVELPELWKAVSNLNLPLLGWGMFIFTAGLWFRGYRWYFLLEGKGQIRPRDAILTTYISSFGNYALPARAGEVMRIIVLGQRCDTSRTMITASVALEKLSDLLTLAGILYYLIGFTTLGGTTIRWIGLVIGLITIVLLSLMVAMVLLSWRFPLHDSRQKGIGISRTRRYLHSFVDGMRPVAHPKHLGRFLVYSVVSWSLITYACYLFLASMGLIEWLLDSSRVGLVGSTLLIVVLMNASSIIPAGPGGAGPYQASVVLAFILLGTGATEPGSIAYHNAAGFSIVYWIGQALPSILVGGAIFFRSGLTTRMLMSAERIAADRMMLPDEPIDSDV